MLLFLEVSGEVSHSVFSFFFFNSPRRKTWCFIHEWGASVDIIIMCVVVCFWYFKIVIDWSGQVKPGNSLDFRLCLSWGDVTWCQGNAC